MSVPYLSDYQKLLLEVKVELHNRPELYDKLSGYIGELEQQKKNAQDQYIETFNLLEKSDYELTNLKVSSEHIGNTLKSSEIENKALKEVVRANGQLLAVVYGDV